jgi:hypothetical protein
LFFKYGTAKKNATLWPGWWLGTMEFYDFPFSVGNFRKSQLTIRWLIFFRGVG